MLSIYEQNRVESIARDLQKAIGESRDSIPFALLVKHIEMAWREARSRP